MLETIREFATERLNGSSEAQCLRARHAGWVSGLALHRGPRLELEADAFHAVQAELPNIRQALTWYPNAPAKYEELASAVWRLWVSVPHAREGRDIFARTLEFDLGPEVRARDLRSASWIAYWLGEYETASRWRTSVWRSVGGGRPRGDRWCAEPEGVGRLGA